MSEGRPHKEVRRSWPGLPRIVTRDGSRVSLWGAILAAVLIATGFVLLVPLSGGERVAGAVSEASSIDFDVLTTNNTATSLGPTETCLRVDNGDIFDVDIVIKDVNIADGGVRGFQLTLSYDGTVLVLIDERVDLFLDSPGSFVEDQSNPLPDDGDGIYTLSALDKSNNGSVDETGSGVLTRLTFQVLAEGLSTLTVDIPTISPTLTTTDGDALQPSDGVYAVWLGPVNDAEIRVGFDCGTASPNAPVADDKAVNVDEDTPTVITLTGSDPDGCGGQLYAFSAVDPLFPDPAGGISPTSGSATCSGSGDLTATMTYTPDPGFTGDDSFTFRFTDSTASSSAATVSITVNPVSAVLIGDANCDGEVNTVDGRLILQFDVGLRDIADVCSDPFTISSPIFRTGADANCDGEVNTVDGSLVLQVDVGLLTELCP